MKEKRLVIILKEGATLHEVFEQTNIDGAKSLVTFPGDIRAEEHNRPLVLSDKAREEEHYNNGFYFRLSERDKELYRTFTIDTTREDELSYLKNRLEAQQHLLDSYYEDGYIQFTAAPTDPEFKYQKPIFDKLEIERAWSIAASQGQGVVVSIVDTGVKSDHPDLVGNLWKTFPDRIGMSDGASEEGHGTCIAGIIGAVNDHRGVIGMAPRARMVMHKLELKGTQSFMSNAEEAFKIAASNGARVVNCSFGLAEGPAYETARAKFISAIKAHTESDNMLFVFSAGNDDEEIEEGSFLAKLNQATSVLMVGVLDPQNDERLRGQHGSNYGKEVVYAYHNAYTTWAKPSSSYGIFGNTSAGAPQISAIAALILGYNPTISPGELKEIIESTVDRLDILSKDEGKGRVNAYAAMQKARSRYPPYPLLV
jgi:subtilisin family serine protease